MKNRAEKAKHIQYMWNYYTYPVIRVDFFNQWQTRSAKNKMKMRMYGRLKNRSLGLGT